MALLDMKWSIFKMKIKKNRQPQSSIGKYFAELKKEEALAKKDSTTKKEKPSKKKKKISK